MNLIEMVTSNVGTIVTTGIAGATLWGLKQIPNEKIAQKFYDGAKYLGVALTLGMTKWSLTKKVWNSTIEPYFIDLVDNTINNAVQGFVDGLRSDNKK